MIYVFAILVAVVILLLIWAGEELNDIDGDEDGR